jgi:putative GTP pyrophosphokinase
MAEINEGFDFKLHEQRAVAEYLKVRDAYRDLAAAVSRIIEECLRYRTLKVHSVNARAKDPNSFGRKASIPSDSDANAPKYRDPLREITDLAGVRIIAYFPAELVSVDGMLSEEFEVIERSDKSEVLLEEDRFGYQSVHYLVRISERRCSFAEYERFRGAIAEVQVRTILQHAWAEIEHDIQYKSAAAIPVEIHRRFTALAGLLEIADREFQAIQDDDKSLRTSARSRVDVGQLEDVEVTPDALKAYLDKTIGPDGRISDWQYDWTAKLLKRLGFRNLKQIDECIAGKDDDRLSRLAWGSRQGQVARFELLLLAGMGQPFVRRHFYSGNDWFEKRQLEFLEKFSQSGVPLGTYDPSVVHSAGATAAPNSALQLTSPSRTLGSRS